MDPRSAPAIERPGAILTRGKPFAPLADTHLSVYRGAMNSKALIRLVEQDGWVLVRVTGSHHHYHHPTKPGIVTIIHPKKDLKKGTEKSILKQAGLK